MLDGKWAYGLLSVAAAAFIAALSVAADPDVSRSDWVVIGLVGAGVICVLAAVAVRVIRSATHEKDGTRKAKTVSLQYLAGLYENHTRLQGDKLVAPYRKGRIRVTGVVDDVNASSRNLYYVTFWSDPHTSLFFSRFRWGRQLDTMVRGSTITVTGKLHSANRAMIIIVKCALEAVIPPSGEGEVLDHRLRRS